MKTIISTVILAILLAGCQTTQNIVKTKLVVAVPDSALYNCPEAKIPSSKGLTDPRVARLLVELYQNNKACQHSLEAIKQYLEEAQKKLETEGN